MPISCHFRDCKSLVTTKVALWQVSSVKQWVSEWVSCETPEAPRSNHWVAYYLCKILSRLILIIIIITDLYSAFRSEDTEALERYRGAWLVNSYSASLGYVNILNLFFPFRAISCMGSVGKVRGDVSWRYDIAFDVTPWFPVWSELWWYGLLQIFGFYAIFLLVKPISIKLAIL